MRDVLIKIWMMLISAILLVTVGNQTRINGQMFKPAATRITPDGEMYEWQANVSDPTFQASNAKIFNEPSTCETYENGQRIVILNCENKALVGWEVNPNFLPGYAFTISPGQLPTGRYRFEWIFDNSKFRSFVYPTDPPATPEAIEKIRNRAIVRWQLVLIRNGVERVISEKTVKPLFDVVREKEFSVVFPVGAPEPGKTWKFRIYTYGNIKMFLKSAQLTCLGRENCYYPKLPRQ